MVRVITKEEKVHKINGSLEALKRVLKIEEDEKMGRLLDNLDVSIEYFNYSLQKIINELEKRKV